MTRTLQTVLQEIEKIPEFSDYQNMSVLSKGIFGNYPIHIAAAWKDREAVEILLKHGANINSVGEDGETPIFYAIEPGNEEFLHFLIAHGARIDVRNNFGKTPLEQARGRDLKDIVNVLESYSK